MLSSLATLSVTGGHAHTVHPHPHFALLPDAERSQCKKQLGKWTVFGGGRTVKCEVEDPSNFTPQEESSCKEKISADYNACVGVREMSLQTQKWSGDYNKGGPGSNHNCKLCVTTKAQPSRNKYMPVAWRCSHSCGDGSAKGFNTQAFRKRNDTPVRLGEYTPQGYTPQGSLPHPDWSTPSEPTYHIEVQRDQDGLSLDDYLDMKNRLEYSTPVAGDLSYEEIMQRLTLDPTTKSNKWFPSH